MNASFLIVLAFTITQYIVVILPLNYARKVTKSRVIICVFIIYFYTILFSVLLEMGVPKDIQRNIDNTLHSIVLIYLIIIAYILLFVAFKRKMAASRSLQVDKNTRHRGRDDKQMGIKRNFIIVNFFSDRHLDSYFSASRPVVDCSVVFQGA